MCQNQSVGWCRIEKNLMGGSPLKIVVLMIGVILLSFVDYGYIRRKNILLLERKIQIREIRPQGWKQILCFIVIPISLIAIVIMMISFYKMNILYTAKRVCIIAILWPIAVCDYQEMRIPNKLILYGLLLRLLLLGSEMIFAYETVLPIIINEGIAILGAVIVCMICMLLSRGSLGMGDLKLMCLMAAFLGIEGICYSMFVSIFFSFIVAVGLLITQKKSKKDAIPFAPFILAGTFVSLIISGV